MLTTAHESDVARIYELWDEYASAFAAGNLERWLSLWTGDGIELSAAGRLLSGAEEISAASRPVMALFDTKMTISPEYVRIIADNAYAYGSYKHVEAPKEGGESIATGGKFLTILEKQASGSWKIAVACFNHGR